VYMREREIAAQYRAGFDRDRYATQALDNLYSEALSGRDTAERASVITVARPRAARTYATRWTREQAREIFKDTRYTRSPSTSP
jgi:hypothetical protein